MYFSSSSSGISSIIVAVLTIEASTPPIKTHDPELAELISILYLQVRKKKREFVSID